MVTRWFVRTLEGDLVDGPFRERRHADRAAADYRRYYRAESVLTQEPIDTTLKYDTQTGENHEDRFQI